jgi:hypothetical protein
MVTRTPASRRISTKASAAAAWIKFTHRARCQLHRNPIGFKPRACSLIWHDHRSLGTFHFFLPLFFALRSDPLALSGVSCRKQTPSSRQLELGRAAAQRFEELIENR